MKKYLLQEGRVTLDQMTPYFLDKGYQVTVYDIMYFTDNFLPKTTQN